MSLTGFHPIWDKILSQNLQAVADQRCHLEGSSPYKWTAFRVLGFTVDVIQAEAGPCHGRSTLQNLGQLNENEGSVLASVTECSLPVLATF
jgi:hypothetical protein